MSAFGYQYSIHTCPAGGGARNGRERNMKGRARHEKLIKTERGEKIADRVEKIAKYERSTALISIFSFLCFIRIQTCILKWKLQSFDVSNYSYNLFGDTVITKMRNKKNIRNIIHSDIPTHYASKRYVINFAQGQKEK